MDIDFLADKGDFFKDALGVGLDVQVPELGEQVRASFLQAFRHALLDGADAGAIGPGLGRHRETCELVRRLLVRLERPLVLDADALFALTGSTALLRQRPAPTVLTPHAGEFARLTGLDATGTGAHQRRALAQRFAADHGVVLVLKGAPSLIALPDGRVLVNPTGNPGMATAGSGDVLTGLIVGLLAQGLAPAAAAAAGVYVHGAAGDAAAAALGEWGMLAGDLLAAVPGAIVALVGQRSAGRCRLPSRPARLDSGRGDA